VFVLCWNTCVVEHHALQFVTQQEKLNQKHVKWVEYMQNFTFVIKHIFGTANKVVDALSRKCLLLQEFKVCTLGFDDLRNMYADDPNFQEAYEAAENPVLRDRSLVDRIHDPRRIVVQRQSTVYSEMLHEGESVEGETQWWIGRTFRS
jgi:hypothetical protein